MRDTAKQRSLTKLELAESAFASQKLADKSGDETAHSCSARDDLALTSEGRLRSVGLELVLIIFGLQCSCKGQSGLQRQDAVRHRLRSH